MEVSESENEADNDCEMVDVVTGGTALLVDRGVLPPATATGGWD